MRKLFFGACAALPMIAMAQQPVVLDEAALDNISAGAVSSVGVARTSSGGYIVAKYPSGGAQSVPGAYVAATGTSTTSRAVAFSWSSGLGATSGAAAGSSAY